MVNSYLSKESTKELIKFASFCVNYDFQEFQIYDDSTHDLEKKYIKIVKYVLNQIFDAKKVVIYIRFTPDQIFSGMDDKLHEV